MASSDASVLSSAASTITGPIDPVIAARQAARNETNNYANARNAARQLGQSPQSVVSNRPFSALLRYPEDIGKYFMTFAFNKYVFPSVKDSAKLYPSGAMIALPVPNSLVDDYSLDYSSDPLDATGAGARAGIEAYRNSTSAQNQTLSGLVGSVSGAAAQSFLVSGAAQLAGGGTLGKIGLNAAGLAQNPMLTVLFNKVNLKKHRFAWKFMPESAQESQSLYNIISQFKKSALPGLTGENALFTVPDVIMIKLLPEDKFLYSFKPCVVESVSINYSPNMPSFFAGTGAPTAIEFSISLLEIEIWTQEDISSGQNNTYAGASGNYNAAVTGVQSALKSAADFAKSVSTGGAATPPAASQ
jgi:hypothetical protein